MVFLGALTQGALAEVLRTADVFVLPSFFEGLPLVVLESIACKCRVVMTDLPGTQAWMPEGLCEEKVVETVPLPRLIATDTPVPEDLPCFVEELAQALTRQLARVAECGAPRQMRRLVAKTRAVVPNIPVSIHLHDTRGLGLANTLAAYEAGVEIFDVSAGGLGGCPFVKSAAVNVAAEDAVNLFHQIGVETGVDLKALCKVVDAYEALLGRPLPGRMNRVLKAQGDCHLTSTHANAGKDTDR